VKINLAWLYAITKYGYPPSMDDTFRTFEDAKRLGFEAIELEVYTEKNLMEFEENKARLREDVESLGLKVVNCAAIFPEMVSPDRRTAEKGLEFFRRTSELATYFNAPMVQGDTFTPPMSFVGAAPYKGGIVFGQRYRVVVDPGFSWARFWGALVEAMRKAARIAADRGLVFTLEPRVGETVSSSDAMLRLLEAVNEDNFGAVLDCGHLNAQKELLPLSIEKLGGKIWYVHVSDNDGRDNYHFAPGKGTIDWDGVFQALKKHGFCGYFAVDVGGKEVKDRLDEEFSEAKRFLEEMEARHGL